MPLHVSSSKCSSSGGPTSINTPSGITHNGVLIQVGPPDDEHLLLEICRGVEINTLRKSASSWSLTRIYVELHSQQNIKFSITIACSKVCQLTRPISTK